MTSNPLVSNILLAAQLCDVSAISSSRALQEWRNTFLHALEPCLDPVGLESATIAYKSFGKRIAHLMELFLQLQRVCHKLDQKHAQHLSSVRARRCLSEISQELSLAIGSLRLLLPATIQQGHQYGYTKLDMSAVCLRDTLSLYKRLVTCDEIVKRFHAMLEHVADDSQTVKTMELFKTQVQIFCDILADLGLYAVMKRSQEIARASTDEHAEEQQELEGDKGEQEKSQEQEKDQIQEQEQEHDRESEQVQVQVEAQVQEQEQEQEQEQQQQQQVEHCTVVDTQVTLAKTVQKKQDNDDNDDNDAKYHCSFCQMAAMNNDFGGAISCWGSGKGSLKPLLCNKGKAASLSRAAGDFLDNSLSTLASTDSVVFCIQKKNDSFVETESETELDLTEDTMSDFEGSLHSLDFEDCNIIRTQSFDYNITTPAERRNSQDEVVTASSNVVSVPLHQERFRTMYTWYARLGQPNRETMKQKMWLLEPRITAQDIDGLPWIHDGQRLHMTKMNALFLQ